MENQLLATRIETYSLIWQEHERMAPGGYDRLMKNDDFWDPLLHGEFEARRGWHKLGSA